MHKQLLVLLGLVALAVLLLTVFPNLREKPCAEGCNVILIMVDTLSANHIGTYGYARDTMPRTTAFFEKQGVIFENATANAPWTLPSFTGMYFSDIATDVTYRDLENDTRASLQSELRDHGYTLRAVVPPPLFFITDAITRLFKREELNASEINTFKDGAHELASLATSTSPFFLLVHTFEAHDPYYPQAPFNEQFATTSAYKKVTREDILLTDAKKPLDPELVAVFRLRYDQGITQADANVSKFLSTIPEEELKKTVIILAADHGEAFGEHNALWHSTSLYEEQLRIPLMMHVPGIAPARIKEPVSLMDLAPTILSLAGIKPPEAFKGDSLVPLLQGRSLPARSIPLVNGMPYYLDISSIETILQKKQITLEEAGALGSDRRIVEPSLFGVRRGAQKAFIDGPRATSTVHWFDLATDPAEQHDLGDGTLDSLPADLKKALNALPR